MKRERSYLKIAVCLDLNKLASIFSNRCCNEPDWIILISGNERSLPCSGALLITPFPFLHASV